MVGILIFGVLFVGGAFLLAAFTGGFASAIVGGGREDNSIFTNACIGFLGWLMASFILAQTHGAWPEEMTGELLLLTFVCALGVAWLRNWRNRRILEQPSVQ